MVLGRQLLVHGDEPPEHGAQIAVLLLRLSTQQVAAGYRREHGGGFRPRAPGSPRRQAGAAKGRGTGSRRTRSARPRNALTAILVPIAQCRGDWLHMPRHARRPDLELKRDRAPSAVPYLSARANATVT